MKTRVSLKYFVNDCRYIVPSLLGGATDGKKYGNLCPCSSFIEDLLLKSNSFANVEKFYS